MTEKRSNPAARAAGLGMAVSAFTMKKSSGPASLIHARFSGCGHLSWSDMRAGPALGRTVTWYWISASSRRVTISRDAMIAVRSVPPGAETDVVLDWFGLMHAAD